MATKNVIKKTALAPTVLIAGGAGFIGSHLVEALLSKEARVIVLDNFSTGKDSYVQEFLNNPKFALYNVDINAGLPTEIETVDYIFHLVDLEVYLENKSNLNLDLLLTNAVGTKNLLDLANRSQAKFLLVSSTDVYKGHLSNASLSNYFGQTLEEENKYSLAEAKRFAEALVWEYYKKFNTDVRLARVPEIYGPKMNLEASGSLGLFLKDIMEGRELTVYGDGVGKEYYLYISDAISGIVKSLLGKDTKGKIFTLTPKEPYSILEVAYVVKGLADRSVNILFKPARRDAGTYDAKIPDTNTLKDLKWEPKITLKDGLMKTLKWYNYAVNVHTFKPAKFIEQKVEEKRRENTVTSLVDMDPVSASPSMALPAAHSSQVLSQQLVSEQELKQKVGFISKLKNRFTKSEPIANIPAKPARKVFWGVLITIGLLAAFFITFIALPLVQTYVYTNRAVEYLSSVQLTLGQLDTPQSQENSHQAFQEFFKAKNSFQRVGWLFSVTGKSDLHTSFSRLLSSSGYFSRSIYNVSKAVSPFNGIWEVMRPTSELTFNGDQFDSSALDLNNAKNDIQLAVAEYKYVNKELFPWAVIEKVSEYEKTLDLASAGINALQAAVTDLPDLLGITKPKRYLILLQNSNEIRPTGGFIGSYAVLSIDKGKITDLMIDDIYNPDGQIDIREIEVPAPEPIKELLKEEFLNIRNANWDPHFPDSAEVIKDLFFKLDGQKFDGVIGIDLFMAKKLLNVTGPLFLTAYNEEITAENVYEKAQYYSEFNYTEGSDQKKSFLTVLGSKLLEKLFALPKDKIPHLLFELHNSLMEKHLLISVQNSSITTLLQEHGWDGGLVPTEFDYLYVVNSNLGGTKANYFVKNTMNYTVSSLTRDGLLRAEVELDYNHTGQEQSWPGGPYTNYVRILTKEGTKLTGATIKFDDGEEQDIFEDIVITSVKRLNSYETTFTLKPQQKVKLIIKYDLPGPMTLTEENKTYHLYWQKQPGTDADPIMFTFNPPLGLKSTPTNYGENALRIEGSQWTDKEFNVYLE